MKQLTQGFLVTVEGIDGSGKSTFASLLNHELGQEFSTILTKEPGDNSLGVQIRKILQEQTTPLVAKAEFLLFAADRAQHVHEIIKPALAAKKLIICDRMADSSVVYQGYARGLDIDLIKRVNAWTLDGVTPDLTFFIRLDPAIGYQRLEARREIPTAFEREKRGFMERVATGYELYLANQPHVCALDGQLKSEELVTQAHAHLVRILNTKQLICN